MRTKLKRRTGLLFATLLVFGLLTVLASGAVLAQEPELSEDNVTVEVENPPLVEGEGQTINVTVENPSDETFVQPIVEVPLAGGLDHSYDLVDHPEYIGMIDGGVDVKFADGTEEERSAFINDSTFRGGEVALQIEGELLGPKSDEGNATKSYYFDLDIETTAEVDIEVDVFPLNDPTNNARVDEQYDPVGLATIDATIDNSDQQIRLLDDEGFLEASDGTLDRDVPGTFEYDVRADISILDDDVSVTVEPDEYATETIEFTDVQQGDAEVPKVTAQTGSTAQVFGTDSRTLTGGNAETNVVQKVEFDLDILSGETRILVEDRANAPLQDINATGDFDAAKWVEIDETNGVAVLEVEGEVDDDVSVDLEGYPLGDVTLDDDVTDADATELAEALASGTIDEIVEYGDVTGDGEFSAADAMKIQQYHEGDRDADYEVNN